MNNIRVGSRWLTNEQAAADSANFMANVKFDGINEDLTAPGTPWIYYGVSILSQPSTTSLILLVGILRRCPICAYENSLSRPRLWIHCFQRFVYVNSIVWYRFSLETLTSRNACCYFKLAVHGCHPHLC